MSVSGDGKVLFATQSTDPYNKGGQQSRIIAIDIDATEADSLTFHQVIGQLNVDSRVFGINSTPNATQMAVTFRLTGGGNGGSFGLLSYEYVNSKSPSGGITLSMGTLETVAMQDGELTGAWDPWDIEIVEVEIANTDPQQ